MILTESLFILYLISFFCGVGRESGSKINDETARLRYCNIIIIIIIIIIILQYLRSTVFYSQHFTSLQGRRRNRSVSCNARARESDCKVSRTA